MGLLACGFFSLAAANSLAAMAALALVAGLAFGPASVSLYETLDEVSPRETGAEALTWMTTAEAAGLALGAAVGGQMVTNLGVSAALITASGASAAGLLIALARRRTLHLG